MPALVAGTPLAGPTYHTARDGPNESGHDSKKRVFGAAKIGVILRRRS
jgi:hypothetical protein